MSQIYINHTAHSHLLSALPNTAAQARVTWYENQPLPRSRSFSLSFSLSLPLSLSDCWRIALRNQLSGGMQLTRQQVYMNVVRGKAGGSVSLARGAVPRWEVKHVNQMTAAKRVPVILAGGGGVATDLK